MNKTVAIHQPNFFPWLGYFDKIARSDNFLFFDDVQYPKKGGVWTNRVKLLISDQPRWATAAIDRNYSGTRQIKEMHFLVNHPWRKKIINSLVASYRRHPFYQETMEVIEPLLLNVESNISEYNIHAVTQIARQIGLDTSKIQRSSAYETTGSSTELLCSLTNKLGGSEYMCGGGAEGYQDDDLFKKCGLQLVYQNFKHPIYTQQAQSKFVPGLSIVDAAMNVGWHGIQNLLNISR